MNKDKEIWKDIPEYEGYYQVSDLGRVKSLWFGKEKILKAGINSRGYRTVVLSKGNGGKCFNVHQLVAMAFLGHKPCGYVFVINHKNFDRLDNRIENIEITTQRENANQKHIYSSSDYTGVFWHEKRQKWQSTIRVNGKALVIGFFKREIEAAIAYKQAIQAIYDDEEIPIYRRVKLHKHKGVSYSERDKLWLSSITRNKRTYFLGCFKSEIDAANAYKKASELFENGEEIPVKKKNKTSKYIGVSYNKMNRNWNARIKINGKTKHLGCFNSEEDAYQSRLNEEKRLKEL